jgi:hypothetical protein
MQDGTGKALRFTSSGNVNLERLSTVEEAAAFFRALLFQGDRANGLTVTLSFGSLCSAEINRHFAVSLTYTPNEETRNFWKAVTEGYKLQAKEPEVVISAPIVPTETSFDFDRYNGIR